MYLVVLMSRLARFKISLLLCSLGAFFGGSVAAQQAQLIDIRGSDSESRTRLVLDFSTRTQWELHKSRRGAKQVAVIRLPDTVLMAKPATVAKQGSRIERFAAVAEPGGQGLRITMEYGPDRQLKYFSLPGRIEGMRLVLDITDVDTLKPVKVLNSENRARALVIAIDAGHGGHDPGASYWGRQEKDVVLKIAYRLQRLLLREPGFHPLLVRVDDSYLSFLQRREIAREAKAELLLSIHADAFGEQSVRGVSVYALSKSGAQRAITEHLLGSDSRSALMGEVDVERLADQNKHLAKTMLNLSMDDTLERSLRVGEAMLKQLGLVSKLHQKTVLQAGFKVLKPTDVPSLLVETGFMSNRQDHKNLHNPKFQEQLAKAIVTGLKDWFSEHPPLGSLFAQRARDRASKQLSPLKHTVGRNNERVADIAHRYGVGEAALRAANSISGDLLSRGQTVLIPLHSVR